MRPIEEKMRTKLDKEYGEKEEDIAYREEQVKKKELEIETEVSQNVESRLKEMRPELEKKASEKTDGVVRDLKLKLELQEKKRQEAVDNEIGLRKKVLEAEDKLKSFDLEVARKVDEETKKVQTEMAGKVELKHRLEVDEYKFKISELSSEVDELSAKVKEGSQRVHGEVLELELESLLRTTFPDDQIEPVPKGVPGADVIQHVRQGGQEYGKIVWESKRTERWSGKWIPKLRQDARVCGSELAVLVSMTMPEEIPTFALVDGIVVSHFSLAIPVAILMRSQVVELAKARRALDGSNTKKDLMYNYLVSPEFKQGVQAVADSFKLQYKELLDEKTAMNRIWKKREAELVKGVITLAEIYGKMQGIAGKALGDIPALELLSRPALNPPAAQS